MSNRSQYKAMMDEIEAPAELKRKVRNIPSRETARRPSSARFATAACTILIGAFLVSNGVCYAATGATWVETVMLLLNGEEVAVSVEVQETGDSALGKSALEAIGNDDGLPESITPSEALDDNASESANNSLIFESGEGGVVIESPNGNVFFQPDSASPINITLQLESQGFASGEFERDGRIYTYHVTGGSGNYASEVCEAQTSVSTLD